MAYMLIFLLKKVSKNTCELNIVLTRTVNILTTNKLVKLTMLWTTGPWFLCPRLPLAGVGHIAFCRDVTCACAYVTFVTRFKFTCKFRCKFTSAFLLQLITFIPSGLESWNFVWHLPTSRPTIVWYRCPRVMPLGGGRGRGIPVLWTHFLLDMFFKIRPLK